MVQLQGTEASRHWREDEDVGADVYSSIITNTAAEAGYVTTTPTATTITPTAMPPTAENMTGPKSPVLTGDWHHHEQQPPQQPQDPHRLEKYPAQEEQLPKYHPQQEPHSLYRQPQASTSRATRGGSELSSTSRKVTSFGLPREASPGSPRLPRSSGPVLQLQEDGKEEDFHRPATAGEIVELSKATRFSMDYDHRLADPAAINEIFHKEPCIHTHRMFCRAANIFAALRHTTSRHDDFAPSLSRRKTLGVMETRPKIQIPEMDFKDTTEKRMVFELAFATLKYQNVFHDMLEDTYFFNVYAELKDDAPLVMVMMWDFQSRKFQPRVPIGDEMLHEACLEIERAILEMKTKLNASLARRRIKASAPSIEHLLPHNVRSKSDSQQPLPVYAWVNQLKTSAQNLLAQLKEEGFTQIWRPPADGSSFADKSFFIDPHCSDVLVFSVDCGPLLQEHPLMVSGHLVREDKSSCMAAHSVLPVIDDDQDVVVVNPGSGLVVAHLASLLMDKGGQVVVISEGGKDAHFKLLRNLELLGATKSCKFVIQAFSNIDFDDSRLKNVRVALVIADCSKSAIKNAVAFVVNEGEDLQILKDLSASEEETNNHLNGLMAKHISVLRHALRVNKLQGAVYLTRSVNVEENEIAVERALEYVNMLQVQKKLMPWRVIPPLLSFSGDEVQNERGVVGKYVKFPPSSMMNGCFLVAIAREPEEPKTILNRGRSKTKAGKGSKSRLQNGGDEGTPGSSQDITPGSDGTPKRKSSIRKTKKPFVPVTNARAALLKKKLSMAEKAMARLAQPQNPVAKTDSKPEHTKIIKHPAPFR